MDDLFRVGDTPYGKGLFAARRITKGRLLSEVTGEIIDDEHYSSSYCIDLGGTFSLEPGEPYRYLNHSCEPNCCLVYSEEDEPPAQIWLEVIRPIAAGEQLTIDYAWPANAAIPCGCGAQGCRGWIVDPDELDLLDSPQPKTSQGFTGPDALPAGPVSGRAGLA